MFVVHCNVIDADLQKPGPFETIDVSHLEDDWTDSLSLALSLSSVDRLTQTY